MLRIDALLVVAGVQYKTGAGITSVQNPYRT